MESNPGDASDTAFTVGKGAILAICLRARRGLPRFHDMETLAFVLVQEMAHVAARMVGYPPAFWRIFKFLLLEAQAVGVLRGDDYARRPTESLCSMSPDGGVWGPGPHQRKRNAA